MSDLERRLTNLTDKVDRIQQALLKFMQELEEAYDSDSLREAARDYLNAV